MSLLAVIAAATMSVSQPAGDGRSIVAQAQTRDCSKAVTQVLSRNDGRLLSVRAHSDRCTVIVLIRNVGKRPEKKVFRVANEKEHDGGG